MQIGIPICRARANIYLFARPGRVATRKHKCYEKVPILCFTTLRHIFVTLMFTGYSLFKSKQNIILFGPCRCKYVYLFARPGRGAIRKHKCYEKVPILCFTTLRHIFVTLMFTGYSLFKTKHHIVWPLPMSILLPRPGPARANDNFVTTPRPGEGQGQLDSNA